MIYNQIRYIIFNLYSYFYTSKNTNKNVSDVQGPSDLMNTTCHMTHTRLSQTKKKKKKKTLGWEQKEQSISSIKQQHVNESNCNIGLILISEGWKDRGNRYTLNYMKMQHEKSKGESWTEVSQSRVVAVEDGDWQESFWSQSMWNIVKVRIQCVLLLPLKRPKVNGRSV